MPARRPSWASRRAIGWNTPSSNAETRRAGMSGRLSNTAAVLSGLLLTSAAAAQVGPHAVINVSQNLLRVCNARDAAALRDLLAPSLQAKYSVEDLQLTLARCHGLTHEVERFSLPSWGARRYG